MADLISTIRLCNVPLTPTHQIDFASKQAQGEYFISKTIALYPNCRYTPRTGTIRIKGYVDTLHNCNYGYYTNTYKDTTKTFYFFIVAKNLVSREVTELTIQLDVFQTYLFDVNFKSCMIERETVSDDTYGIHTIPEKFELGDYVTVKRDKVNELTGDVCYFVAVTDSDTLVGSIYGKTYSGFELKYFGSSLASRGALTNYIKGLCESGKADAIAFIFSFPQNLLHSVSGKTWADGETTNGFQNMYVDITPSEYQKTFFWYQESYTPRNKKLLTYPYNFLTVNNPSGGNVILKYELFARGVNHSFRLEGVLAQNSKFVLTPWNYNGKNPSYEDGIECNGFGLCSWNNDNYANWYANNQNSLNAQSMNSFTNAKTSSAINSNTYENRMANNDMQAVKGLVSGLSGIASGAFGSIGGAVNGIGSAINSGIDYTSNIRNAKNDLGNASLQNTNTYENNIRSIMASVDDAKVQPNSCKGDTSACGIDVARDSNTFFLNQTMIKPEYARMIDSYFQMFGYKVNRLGVPSFNKRTKWDFIKTVNSVVKGNIPTEDADSFASLLNNGLTVWHNETYMYEYDQDNPIK